MDKKLLSTAIAGALAGTMAFGANAGTTIFGHIDQSILAWDVDGGGDDINLRCTTCSVGFKGTEDLGNGLKVKFKLDFQYDMNNRNRVNNDADTTVERGAITDRDQWIGLAGNFGEVKFGSISSGYKSTGAMIDPLYRTVVQARDMGLQSNLHSGAGEEGQGRMTNHVRYDSPNLNGFKVIVDYVFDGSEADGENDNPWGITGVYKNGPALVYGSYLTNDRGGKDDAWKIGGSYAFGDAKVFAQYENDGGLISQKSGGTVDGADVWHIGGTYTMGSNMLYFAYGQGDDDSSAANTEYDTWTLAGAHSFSKRTMIYAGYNNQDYDASGEIDNVTIGIKHKF
ncbi:porin [Thiohalobacter sp.]|uniref:porin n=1 Tax=Thiohalobacter sp. TaxID=2025948 RepID=UPI0026233DC8|nr:porin [Thiohalobacter sp.]